MSKGYNNIINVFQGKGSTYLTYSYSVILHIRVKLILI